MLFYTRINQLGFATKSCSVANKDLEKHCQVVGAGIDVLKA